MGYTVYISKKNFQKIDLVCENFLSYRECAIRKIEEKYGVRFNKKFNDHKKTKTGKSVYIHLNGDEAEIVKEIAKQENTTVRQLILSILGIE